MRSNLSCHSPCVFFMTIAFIFGCGGGSSGDGATLADMGVDGGSGPSPLQGDFNLINAQARSCDVLVDTNGHNVDGVDFYDTVNGVSQTRSPKLAISFTLRSNETGVGRVAAIRLTSGNLSDLRILSATCFDDLGNAIEDTSPVRIGGGGQ